MVQIRKRWPILTALAAGLVYGANHYQIAGFEHLRLEPRESANATGDLGDDTGYFGSESGTAQYPLAGLGTTLPMGKSSSSFEDIPPWSSMLSMGEKLAMWQEGTAKSASGFGVSEQPSLPISTPIPLPPGVEAGIGEQVAYINQFASGPPGEPSARNITRATAGATSPRPQTEIARGNLISKSGEFVASGGNGNAQRIKIASFNLEGLGEEKLAKPHVSEILSRILRQYDVVALQEVQSSRDDILPQLVERLNQSGGTYDYLIGPRVGRFNPREQYAFIFDTSRVETDRFQLYTVDDPEDLMAFDPLVAWFRCKGAPHDRAFTFSLVNLRIDPNNADAERSLLPNLIAAIERDGRQEDDWIVLGDIAGGSSELSMLRGEAVRFAVQDMPTDVAGEHMQDILLFSARGTTEFTGRSGTFDFLLKFNLSIERALEVSDHLPVWAEFSCLEGAEPGRIAPFDPQGVL